MRKRYFIILPLFISLLPIMSLGADPKPQNEPKDPKIAYFFPAGGQRGTTFHMLAGGRQITKSNQVILSGKGVHARVIQDVLSLHINDPEERQLINKMYLEALGKMEGRRFIPRRQKPREESSDQKTAPEKKTSKPTEEYIMQKYPFMDLMRDPKLSDLEMIYYYYFSPRLERKPLEEALNRGVMLEITIDPDAEPGDRDLRLAGPAGITPPARFIVGTSREIIEIEPNDSLSEDPLSQNYRWKKATIAPNSIKESKPLKLPVTVNGQIHAGDIDYHQFKAQRGQKIVIEVLARHLRPYLADAVPGWFQPCIALYDPEGKKVEEAMFWRYEPDPVILADIEKEGVYTLKIQDSVFRGRDDFVYRINIGPFPMVTSVFPLGGKIGDPLKLNLKGWNLPSESLSLQTDKLKSGIQSVSQLNGKQLLKPILFEVGDLPEMMESEPNNELDQANECRGPIMINGRISDKNDADLFKFKCRKGGRLICDVMARTLNSPLDAKIELLNADGKLIAENDDRSGPKGPNIGLKTHHADPYLSVELPETGYYYIRLYDITRKGGEAFAYRLRISQQIPDFSVYCDPSGLFYKETVKPIKCHVIRKDGFEGEVRIRIANSDQFRIGNGLIPKGKNEGELKITALAGLKEGVHKVVLEASADIKGEVVTHSVMPADEYEQAFIWHHLLPAESMLIYKRIPRRPPKR
ncbi:MAG: PPC domain-containing protein [Planctomycetia bacterium]|nr:PPC domain-containing protein [Planctomycetia bacterium]